jgi:hypothetical protein
MPSKSSALIKSPAPLLADIRALILDARERIAQTVNAGLVLLHWHVGQRIRKDILKEKRAGSRALTVLHTRGILSREPIDCGHGYACHAILRDHFRALLLRSDADIARRAADLLTGQPSDECPQSTKQIEPLLFAIELLIEAGDLPRVDHIFKSLQATLTARKRSLSHNLVLRLVGHLVSDDEKRDKVRKQLGEERLDYYLKLAGSFAVQAGRLNLALDFLEPFELAAEPELGRPGDSASMMAVAATKILLGQLIEGQRIFLRVSKWAYQLYEMRSTDRNLEDLDDLAQAVAGVAYSYLLQGRVADARAWLIISGEYEHRRFEDFDPASSRWLWWSEWLLRAERFPKVGDLVAQCKNRFGIEGWKAEEGMCDWILAWGSTLNGKLALAGECVENAERTLSIVQLVPELARLHITGGDLALARKDAAGALHRAAEALALAQPRGMKLVHADALVLRGRARLLETKPDKAIRALDDAADALRIARDCGYPRAERDALFLEADARHALAGVCAQSDPAGASRERTAATQATAEAKGLAAKLLLTKEDLARADHKARARLSEWKMKKSQPGRP